MIQYHPKFYIYRMIVPPSRSNSTLAICFLQWILGLWTRDSWKCVWNWTPITKIWTVCGCIGYESARKKGVNLKAIKIMARLSLYTLSCLISLMCNCIIFCTLYLAENHLKWFSIANILKSFDIANDFQISKLSNQDELLPNRLLHG